MRDLEDRNFEGKMGVSGSLREVREREREREKVEIYNRLGLKIDDRSTGPVDRNNPRALKI